MAGRRATRTAMTAVIEAERVDGLVGGVGQHDDRADGQTDDDLHDGEADVEHGRQRRADPPTRAPSPVRGVVRGRDVRAWSRSRRPILIH